MSRPDLSPRQADLWRFIARTVLTTGVPPTAREACLGLGISPRSTNAVHAHVRALQAKGYISRGSDAQSRSATVLMWPPFDASEFGPGTYLHALLGAYGERPAC